MSKADDQSRVAGKDSFAPVVSDFMPFIRSRAAAFKPSGFTVDDLVQEGCIGLMQACRSFDSNRSVPFESFARRCIVNRMISYVRKAMSAKNLPLRGFISLDNGAAENAADNSPGPEDHVLRDERLASLHGLVSSRLSHFERNVLFQYLIGKSYSSIAIAAGCTSKAVDNALCRIRNKLRKFDMPE